jgi:NADH-quinone oxidoreductase subunit L
MFSSATECVDSRFVILGHSFDSLTLISMLLFLGAVGKSAQLGLHG